MTAYILDSGFLYASIDSSDTHHHDVARAASLVRGRVVLPIPAITETAHFVAKNLGVEQLADFISGLSKSEFDLLSPSSDDFERAGEIIRKYNDANSDFVDACIFAMAERLNISTVMTVDRRHFSVFRPSHCEAFEILP